MGTTSAHWGEDLAAWRRFAVEKTFPEIAAKIAQAATDDEGMTLGHVQVADDVGALGHAHPTGTITTWRGRPSSSRTVTTNTPTTRLASSSKSSRDTSP